MAIAYPSAILLTGMNLLLVGGAVIGRIQVYSLAIIWWVSGIVMAIFTILKIQARQRDAGDTTVDADPFDWSILGYSLFVVLASAVTGWIIAAIALSYDGTLNSVDQVFSVTPKQALGWIGRTIITWPVMVYGSLRIIGHAYSFINNYLRRREYRRTHELLQHAVARISAPELFCIVLLPAAVTGAWPVWIVAAATSLVDVVMHLLERMSLNPDAHPPAEFQA